MKSAINSGLLGLVGPFTKIARAMSGNFAVEVIPAGLKVATDGERIYIPFTSDHLSEATQQRLNGHLDHEVGHVIEEREHRAAGRPSPMDVLKGLVRERDNRAAMLFNVFDDIRIEHKYSAKYPGMGENLKAKNREVVESFKSIPKDRRERSNFWHELGVGLFAKRDGEGMEWVREDILPYVELLSDELEAAKTARWASDVLALAKAAVRKVHDRATEAMEEPEPTPPEAEPEPEPEPEPEAPEAEPTPPEPEDGQESTGDDGEAPEAEPTPPEPEDGQESTGDDGEGPESTEPEAPEAEPEAPEAEPEDKDLGAEDTDDDGSEDDGADKSDGDDDSHEESGDESSDEGEPEPGASDEEDSTPESTPDTDEEPEPGDGSGGEGGDGADGSEDDGEADEESEHGAGGEGGDSDEGEDKDPSIEEGGEEADTTVDVEGGRTSAESEDGTDEPAELPGGEEATEDCAEDGEEPASDSSPEGGGEEADGEPGEDSEGGADGAGDTPGGPMDDPPDDMFDGPPESTDEASGEVEAPGAASAKPEDYRAGADAALEEMPVRLDLSEIAREEMEKAIVDDARAHRRYVPNPEAMKLDNFAPARPMRLPGESLADLKKRCLDGYHKSLGDVSAQIGALRGRQQAILQTATRRRVLSGLESGRLDDGLLANVRTSDRHVFQEMTRNKAIDTAIEVLVDMSGSMGDPNSAYCAAYYAKRTTVALAESWESLRVPYEIMGFYNEHGAGHGNWYGRAPVGCVARAPFRFPIFKGWDERLSQCRERFEDMRGYGDNADGEAVMASARRLALRKEKRKILVVISDGEPAHSGIDCSTLGRHLTETIKTITSHGIEVWGIGAGTEAPRRYYNEKTGAQNIIIRELSKLAPTLFNALRDRLLVREV